MSDIYDMLDGITRLCAAGLHSSGMELQISANEALAVCGAAFERCREQFHERDADNERLRAVLDAARPICLRWETRGLGPNLPGEKPTDAELLDMLCEKVRALDGTNPTHLSTSVEVFVQPCPTCGREAHDAR